MPAYAMSSNASAYETSRRAALAAGILLPTLSSAFPAAANGTRAAFVGRLNELVLAAKLDPRECVSTHIILLTTCFIDVPRHVYPCYINVHAPPQIRVVFHDACAGGRNGSIHFSEELQRPENVGLKVTVEAIGRIKAALDADSLAAAPISWTDVTGWAARGSQKAAFDALLASRAAEGKAETLLKAYANEWVAQPLGGVDAAAPSGDERRVAIPPGGAQAGVAAWRATFLALGLREADFVLLGPDVIGPDPEAAERLFRGDPILGAAMKDLDQKKKLLTRTPFEAPYARSFTDLAACGRTIDVKLYQFLTA